MVVFYSSQKRLRHNLKINTYVVFTVICGHAQRCEISESLICMFPDESNEVTFCPLVSILML